MATGHSLSVVTNSCVKRPRKPRTNLPETLLEREGLTRSIIEDGENFSTLRNGNGYDDVEEQEREYFAQSHTHRSVGGSMPWEEDAIIDQLTHDVENLTSEEFYKRLKELKNKHRTTLDALEARYNEQSSSQNYYENGEADVNGFDRNGGIDKVKGMTRSGPVYVAEHKHKHIDDDVQRFNQSLPAWSALPQDNVRDMSKKPPTGKPRTAWSDRPLSKSRTSRTQSPGPGKRDWTDITWTSDSECSATTEEIISSVNTSLSLSLNKQPGSPAAVVDNMWDEFSVDSYAPRSRSASRNSAYSSGSQQSKSKEWSPKITIPKPFSMSLRATEEKKKSRASQELDRQRLEREKQEEIECQRQFKATPVPAQTFLPLYDELVDQQIEKSKTNREKSKQKTLGLQKPFKLTDTKKHVRSKSASLPVKKTKTPQFKAKPVPKSVFDPTIGDRILEEEEYRKIRIKMRAEELMRQSSLPPNMQIRGKDYTDGKMRQKMMSREKKAFLTKEHKFQPQVNGEIPDYDELYHKFQQEVQRKKREKEPTVVEPFNLRTARIPSRKAKVLAEMEDEERRRKEAMRGTMSKSASFQRSLDSSDTLPSKMTVSAELRKSATSKSLMQQAIKEREVLEKERQQRYKQKKLQKFIANKAKANDTSQSLETTNREKLKQYRQSDKAREEEYERELQEMMARIESRPLLFERESEINAKKRAERKYQQALKDAGISEDFLVRKGRSGATEVLRKGGADDNESDASDDYGRYSSDGGAGAGKAYSDDDDFDKSSDDF